MKKFTLTKSLKLAGKSLLIITMLLMSVKNIQAQVLMSASGSYSQNFDALASTGTAIPWIDNSVIPNWYAQRSGTGTTYSATTGTNNAGGLYSFGSTGSTERSIGSVGSNNVVAGGFAYGVQLKNTSGSTISDIKVSYTLEQWRNSAATDPQQLYCYYKISSNPIDSLNPADSFHIPPIDINAINGWIAIPAMTLLTPVNGGTAGALDGNLAANRVSVADISIPGLNLANNQFIMIKWEDSNHVVTDHGVGIDDVNISWTVSSVQNPSIVAGTLNSFGDVLVGSTSASQNFSLSGSNLTGFPGSITVTSPGPDFQVSLNGTTWSSSISVPYSSATLSSTTIYVHFIPQSAGVKSGNISITGGGTTTAVTVAVTGNGTVPANPVLSAGTLNDFGNIVVPASSASQTFSLSGTDLTGAPGNITVTSPGTDFQVSLDGTTWSSSVSVPYTTSTLAPVTIYVMFTPQTVGPKSGNITITGGGAPSVTVAVSGTGINSTPPPTTGVKISQIYGGGGSSSATFNADYVELHNNSNTAIDISGYKIMYGASAGNLGSVASNVFTFPAGVSMPAGSYVLVATVAGSGLADLPVAADYTFSLTMSSTNGKIAFGTADMLSNTTYAGQPAGSVLDFVGYGPSANESETAPTAVISTTTAAFRNNNGCDDTDNNQADFSVAAPNPRNSSSPFNNCSGSVGPALFATSLNSFGNVVVLTNSTSQTFNLSGSNLTGAPGVIAIASSGPDFQVSNDGINWSSSTTISYNAATLSSTAVYVMFTPQTLGPITGTISITGGGVTTAVNVSVSGTGISAPSNATLSATSLVGFGDVCNNNTAGPNTFDINGTELTTADITVGPLNGFSFSLTESGPYTPTLTISQPGGSYTQTIYVTFTPTIEGSYDGDITISGGGATNAVTVAATGNGTVSTSVTLTGDSTSITTNSAVLAGSLASAGCTNVTSYGIEYSGINGFIPGSGTRVFSTNMSGTNFSSTVNGLVQNSAYYYRAFSVNNGGYSYGEQKSFITLPIAGGLVIYSNPLVRGTNVHYSLSGIKPGHYAVKLFNSVGQLVFQRDMIVQVGFIDDNFIMPSKLPAGVYTFQVFNPEFNIQKPVLVH